MIAANRFYSSIGCQFRTARVGAGWTQEELAYRVGMGGSASDICMRETGRRPGTIREFCAIARALSLDPAEVLRIAASAATATD